MGYRTRWILPLAGVVAVGGVIVVAAWFLRERPEAPDRAGRSTGAAPDEPSPFTDAGTNTVLGVDDSLGEFLRRPFPEDQERPPGESEGVRLLPGGRTPTFAFRVKKDGKTEVWIDAREEDIPWLLKDLGSDLHTIRQRAARALGSLGAKAATAIGRLMRLMEGDPDLEVRQAAREALQKIVPP